MEEASGEIRVGISACLLGQRVRYDGGHKRDDFLSSILARFVSFVPVCPEVEIGLGTPREPIRLERSAAGIRLAAPGSGLDHTEAMRRYAARKTAALEKLDLCGYILKKDSPSCGMERVRVHDRNGVPSRSGRGLFAEALMERLPLLPVEEEGRLRDPRLRENFFERVFAYRRLRSFFTGRWSTGGLVRFHTAEKLLLMAHAPSAYAALGRLVAGARRMPRGKLSAIYPEIFMKALARIATPGRHANVLQHMLGYFKGRLPDADRAELAGAIEDFRRRLVPLIVPITLFRHHVRAQGIEYLAGQTYLEPHPRELMLRNHA